MAYLNLALAHDEWADYQTLQTELAEASYLDSLLAQLLTETGLPLQSFARFVAEAEDWQLQHVAEAANWAAKVMDDRMYDLKDAIILELVRQFPECCFIRYSWSMAEVVVQTTEYGENSFHTLLEWEHFDHLQPAAREWCGISRQYTAFWIHRHPKLQRVLAWASLRTCGEDDPLAERVESLLDSFARKLAGPEFWQALP